MVCELRMLSEVVHCPIETRVLFGRSDTALHDTVEGAIMFKNFPESLDV